MDPENTQTAQPIAPVQPEPVPVQPTVPPIVPPNPSVVQIPPVPAPSKFKLFLVLGGLILVVVTTGFLLAKIYNASLSTAKPTPTLVPTQTLVPTPTPDPTTDWKIYTNTKYGFNFKYPDDMALEKGPKEDQPDSYFATVSNLSFSGKTLKDYSNSGVVYSFFLNPKDFQGNPVQCSSSRDCMEQHIKTFDLPPENFRTFNQTIFKQQETGFEYLNTNPLYNQKVQGVFFPYKDNLWQISLTINMFEKYPPEEINNLFSQILSTFQFLE